MCSDWGSMMFDLFELCLALAWVALPAIFFTAGCYQFSRAYWSRIESRRAADAYRADLYRVAGSVARRRRLSDRMAQALKRIEKERASEYVGLHREKNCGCPNCGDSYGEQFLTDWSDDVG